MRRWLIHFGNPVSETNWNTFNFTTSPLTDLIDVNGVSTTVSLSLALVTGGANVSGTTASSVYPSDVTSNSIYSSNNGFNGSPPIYTLTISGLNPAKRYHLTCYASRMDVTDIRTSRYTVGSTVAFLDAANNINNTTTLYNLTPDGSGNIVFTWDGDPATNTNPNLFGYLSVLDMTEEDAFVGGTASFDSATTTTVSLSSSAPSGGSGTYSYQWHRSTTGGFTPGSGTAVAGATGLTFDDTTAQPGILYFYRVVVSDGVSSITSNQVMGALNVPTAPLSIAFHGQVILGYIGSSTWAIDTGSGTIPALIETDLSALNTSASITTVNGAVGGSTSANWVPGQSYYTTLKSNFMAAGTGFKVLRLMIGSNDAAAGTSVPTWLANIQAIIDDASTWVDLIILEEIGVRLDGGDATINKIAQFNAARGSVTGGKVLVGTAFTLANQATHLSGLSGDNVHQNQAGSIYTAGEQAVELSTLITAVAPAINGRIVVRPNGNSGTITITVTSTAGNPSPTVLTFDDALPLRTFILGTGVAGGGVSRFGLDL